MTRNRLEAFSDGVIAIIITIMALELRPPAGTDLADLAPVVPTLLSYALSFTFLAIYWNNHHHLLHAVQKVDGRVLWANAHLLFWLSLTPFVTAWMGEHHAAAVPVAAYGAVLLFSAIAFFLLIRSLLPLHAHDSKLARALGRDWKGKLSVVAPWPFRWRSRIAGRRSRSMSPWRSSGWSPTNGSSGLWSTITHKPGDIIR